MRYLIAGGDAACYYILHENGPAWRYEFEPRKDGERYATQIKAVNLDTRFITPAISVPLLSDEEKEHIKKTAEYRPMQQIVLIIRNHPKNA